MGRLIPADEQTECVVDADDRPVAEDGGGAVQVGGGARHVPRLVSAPLDDGLAPQSGADQVDQPIEPDARPAADVKRLASAGGGGERPREGAQNPVHSVTNIGIVALARTVAVHLDRLPAPEAGGEAGEGGGPGADAPPRR